MKEKLNITKLSLLLIGIDQLSKLIIKNFYPFNFLGLTDKGQTIISNFLYILHVENKGAAWGMLSNNIYLLIGISLIVLYLIIKYIFKDEYLNNYSIIYYSLIISGIIGNLIDRVINLSVTDFINFYIFGYNYPVFNLADTFIVIAVIMIIFESFRGDKYDLSKR